MLKKKPKNSSKIFIHMLALQSHLTMAMQYSMASNSSELRAPSRSPSLPKLAKNNMIQQID